MKIPVRNVYLSCVDQIGKIYTLMSNISVMLEAPPAGMGNLVFLEYSGYTRFTHLLREDLNKYLDKVGIFIPTGLTPFSKVGIPEKEKQI